MCIEAGVQIHTHTHIRVLAHDTVESIEHSRTEKAYEGGSGGGTIKNSPTSKKVVGIAGGDFKWNENNFDY